MLAVLEERDFVVGDRLSAADFNAAYTLGWANEEEMLGDAPRLREYLKTMYAPRHRPHRRGVCGDGD